MTELGNCRRNQLLLIKQHNEDGVLSGAEAAKRITTIEKWAAVDDKLISTAAKKQTDSVQKYAAAVALADADDPSTLGSAEQILARAEAETTLQPAVLTESFVTQPGEEVTAAPTPPPPPPPLYFVTAKSGARLRGAAAKDAEPLDLLPHGSSIVAKASDQADWLETTWRGKRGFVHRDLLSTEAPKMGGVTRAKVAVLPTPAPALAPKPPARGAARMLKVRRQQVASKAPRDQLRRAVADRKFVAAVLVANSGATSNLATTVRATLRS